MSDTIEALYYGNITLSERSFRRTGEYAHILQLATRNEEKLIGTLTEAQKEALPLQNQKSTEAAHKADYLLTCANNLLLLQSGRRN